MIYVTKIKSLQECFIQTQCLEIQDILIEIKLQTPSITIGASYGDALMAMIGVKHINDFAEAKKLIDTGKVYYPNLENTKKYEPYYRIYIELYKQNKKLMSMMDEIN